MYIKELINLEKSRNNIFILFNVNILLFLIFILNIHFNQYIYIYPFSIIIFLFIINLISFFIIPQKKYEFKKYFLIVIGIILFSFENIFLYHLGNYSFESLILILYLSVFFIEDKALLYTLITEIILILMNIFNPKITYLLYLSFFLIFFSILISYLKKISIYQQKKVDDITKDNMDLENLKTSNINFISQIMSEIDNYVKNVPQDKDLKKNIITINNLSKKINKKIEILNNDNYLDISVFKIDKLISEILEELYPLIKSKEISFKFSKYTKEDYFINSDMRRIKEILYEVIENSIIFSLPKGLIEIIQEKSSDKLNIIIINDSDNDFNEKKITKLNYSHGEGSSLGYGLFITKKYSDITQGSIDIIKKRKTYKVISSIYLKFII